MENEKQTAEQEVISTAKKRFAYSVERFSENKNKMREDIRFAAASPDDPWQWEEQDKKARQNRPMLTINKMPQHIYQVTNDIAMNRPSIKYRPADDEADEEVAEILMGIARSIEAVSDADVAYDVAAKYAVTAGMGYIRVLTDYVDERSFNQQILIKPIEDIFKVWDDPDAKDPAGADRQWFFIEECLSEEEFQKAYPDADKIDWDFDKDTEWLNSAGKTIRVVEYYEIAHQDDELYLWANGETSLKSEGALPEGVIAGEQPIDSRKVRIPKVLWRKLNSQQILEGGEDGQEIPCRYIPVARSLGNVWTVEEKSVISGIVRNAKDSQRVYNAGQSAILERVLSTSKAPYIASAEAISGYEKIWQTANTDNHSYLPYNALSDDGQLPIQMPQRTQPTAVEPGLQQVVMGAADDIKSETGQYDASLGQRSNETSGKAIMARQREGDTATFHYIKGLNWAVRHVGRIILDMIPRVMDTRQIARIVGEDGQSTNATLDPKHPEAITKMKDDQGAIQRIFNPNIGTYDVYTSTGPSFTTRRMEAADAMTQLVQANPDLWGVIGDKLVQSMDWPEADDMAKRLRAVLNPAVLQAINDDDENAIPPQIQQQMEQMQMQMQAMQQQLAAAAAEIQKAKNDDENTKRKLGIDAYGKETDRLKVIGAGMTPDAIAAIVMQTMQQVLNTPDPSQIALAPPPQEMMQQQPMNGVQ